MPNLLELQSHFIIDTFVDVVKLLVEMIFLNEVFDLMLKNCDLLLGFLLEFLLFDDILTYDHNLV